MINKLKNLSYNNSILLGFIFYILTILVHILILTSIIPLTWINGGHSVSLDAQFPLSVFNLVISLFGISFLIYAYFYRDKKITLLTSCLLSALWLFGFLQQFLGTPFEQFVISFLLLLGLVSHLRISLGQ